MELSASGESASSGRNTLELLLGWLDDDPDRAGERYEAIRAKLIKIFVCRGCTTPEDLADQTIDRVAGKVPELAPRYSGPPEPYFYRVAQFIYFEHLRRQRPAPPPPCAEPAEDREADYACLDRCLERLTPADRALIQAYYQGEKGLRIERRRQLAEQLGIGTNILRVRLHRIRKELRNCVTRCRAQGDK
jgi:RNA polymerase sigma factor (sigma-70 family)